MDQITLLKDDIASLNQRLAARDHMNELLSMQNMSLNQKLKDQESLISNTQKELKEKLNDFENNINQLTEERNRLLEIIDQLEKENKSLANNHDSNNTKIQKLENSNSSKEASLRSLQLLVESRGRSIQCHVKQINSLKAERAILQQTCRDLRWKEELLSSNLLSSVLSRGKNGTVTMKPLYFEILINMHKETSKQVQIFTKLLKINNGDYNHASTCPSNENKDFSAPPHHYSVPSLESLASNDPSSEPSGSDCPDKDSEATPQNQSSIDNAEIELVKEVDDQLQYLDLQRKETMDQNLTRLTSFENENLNMYSPVIKPMTSSSLKTSRQPLQQKRRLSHGSNIQGSQNLFRKTARSLSCSVSTAPTNTTNKGHKLKRNSSSSSIGCQEHSQTIPAIIFDRHYTSYSFPKPSTTFPSETMALQSCYRFLTYEKGIIFKLERHIQAFGGVSAKKYCCELCTETVLGLNIQGSGGVEIQEIEMGHVCQSNKIVESTAAVVQYDTDRVLVFETLVKLYGHDVKQLKQALLIMGLKEIDMTGQIRFILTHLINFKRSVIKDKFKTGLNLTTTVVILQTIIDCITHIMDIGSRPLVDKIGADCGLEDIVNFENTIKRIGATIRERVVSGGFVSGITELINLK